MAPKPLCFQMNHISKRYPGVQALDDVTFSVKAGEVHALVGQNGAGKSTLVKILSGVVQADSGEIILEGRDVTISSPREAQAQGVGIVHQEFSQAPHMTVAENIFLGRELARDEGLLRLVRFDEMERKVQACLKELGVSIAPGATVGSLSVSEQQIVEIAKVVSFEAKIVIMDEPTAALSQQEIARLFAIIRRLKSNGVSVVYISHRLDEVFEIADTVTVLKDGKKVVTLNVADTDVETLITLMVGYEPKESAYETISSKKNPFLELRDISDGRMLKGVDLVVYEGEILGIFGAVGAGKSELARAIFGANECEGSIKMYGQEINPRCPIDAIELGIGYLPEDRKNHGLNLGLPVLHNVTLPSLSKVTRFGIVNARRENDLVSSFVSDLSIRLSSMITPTKFLSGGNQQKTVVAKWLFAECKLLLIDEPTRGIDVEGKEEIYKIIRNLAALGKNVIIISSDVDEVLRVSTRIAVMSRGRIVDILDAKEATKNELVGLATGGR